MDIPAPLKESVETGNAILLLGAGASLSAKDKSGKSPPKTSELASLLAHKFVSPDYAEASLVQVADYAINESSLFQVQDFLREVFLPFQPSDNHRLLPTFRWRAIVTTNYDCLSVALQLSRIYEEQGDIESAQRTLKNALEANNVFICPMGNCC